MAIIIMKKYMRILGKTLPAFILASIISINLTAQTGPGGIGNSDGSDGEPELKLWLLPDSLGLVDGNDVVTWTDYSGNNNDLSAEIATSPFFRNDSINGHDILEFSKSNNRIIRNAFDMPTDAVAVFMVLRTGDSGDGVLSYAVTGSDNEYLFYQSNSLTTYISGSNDNSNVAYNDNTWKIFGHQWRSSDGRLYIHIDGTQDFTNFQSGTTLTTGGTLAIGGEQDGVNSGYTAGQAFQGDIAEFIMFGSSLKQADRVVIENYLAQKYGLDANLPQDRYIPDDATYIVALTGMGKEMDGTTELEAEGIVITQNGGFDNGEYILAAHDGTVNAINKTPGDVLHADIEARWQRDWYLDKSGTVNAKIAFDFSKGINGKYPANIENYRLLYKANLGDNYDTVTVAGRGIQNGDQIYFSVNDADLLDGYYGLASVDTTNSPLDGVDGRSWYTLISGDWDNWEVWTLDPSGALPNNPEHLTPTDAADKVFILTGKTVTVATNNKSHSEITVNGRLDIANTSGHSFGFIKGNGRILLSSDNFPTGDATDFITAGQGEGTVEYYGTSFDLIEAREFFDVEIDMDDPNQTLTLLNDYTINGDLRITQGELQFNDNASTTDLNVTVNGELGIETNGKILTGTGNARHQLNLYGNFINDGTAEFTNRVAPNYTAEANDGIVDVNFLNDNKNQTASCNGPTNFYRIEIDKGTDDTYQLIIETADAAYFNLLGYANQDHTNVAQLDDGAGAANQRNPNALGLYRGTVRIKNNVSIARLNGSGNYNISEAARLWVDGGTVQKNSGNSLVPYGAIQLSSGLLEAEVVSGITTRANGLIKVEGGILNTNVIRTSVFGPTNVGGYVQSGGIVNIVNPGAATNNYYHFSMTYPGNIFNMSGGILHIYDASGTATGEGGIFIASDPENINVSGGTVIAEIASTTNPFKITSTAPFYNLILRNTFDAVTDHILDAGTDINGDTTANLAAQPLVILNDLTIEDDCFLDHNGEDITVGAGMSISSDSQQQGTNNYGLLYSGALPNTLTFNGSTSDTLYIGYDAVPSDGYEMYVWNLTVNKTNGAEIVLKGDPEKDPDNVTNEWHNRLINVQGTIDVQNGTFNQGRQSIRLYGPVKVKSNGVLGIYEAGVTDTTAYIMLKDNDTELETETGAEMGNFKLNPQGTAVVSLGSDIYIKRIGFHTGLLNLKTYKLKVDYLHNASTTNNYPFGVNAAKMIYSDANASDGGIEIYIPAGTTDDTDFGIPLGTTADGVTRSTPAEIRISNVSDDGYIQIRPVDGELKTTNLSGGNLLSYYWRVGHSEFTTLPDARLRFRYNDHDDDVPDEGNFVQGKVLDEDPYTRSSPSGWVNTTNNTIGFNATTIENANYTAGVANRFTGAPNIYYTNSDYGHWNDGSIWHLGGKAGPTGTVPEEGSIAIIYRDDDTNRGRVWGQTLVNEPAEIKFEHNYFVYPTSNGENIPRLQFDAPGAYPVGRVTGTGMLSFNANFPITINGDIGDFGNNNESYILYFGGNDNTLTNIPTPIPNLYMEGGTKRIGEDITVNNDFILNGWCTIYLENDIDIKRDMVVGMWAAGDITFPAAGPAVTVTVGRNIDFTQINNSNDRDLNVEDGGDGSIEHKLILKGNIIHSDQNGNDIDFYNGDNRTKVILELQGEGDNSYYRSSTSVPQFYRIIMNKGTSQLDTFTFNNHFTLGGLADGNSDQKALYMQNGTLILDDASINIDLTSGGEDFSIPSTSSLEIRQGQVNASGGSGILLDGKLYVNGGTVDMSGGDNYIEYSASGNATIEVTSGSLTVGSQIRRSLTSTEGILTYNQSGGTVIVGNNTAPENNRGVFEILNTGSSFTHTGGDIYIARAQTNPSFASVYLDPETSTFGEGTKLRLGYSNTPVNQTISIYSTIDIPNLVVDASSATPPTAQQWTVPLTITDSLEIEAGATFDANGQDLTLHGDLIVNGNFMHSSNTTYFSSTGNQQIVGSPVFWNLTKDATGTLALNNNITILNVLRHESGVLDDNGHNFSVKGDVYFDGDHTWGGSGDGILLDGTEQQNLEGSGTYGKLSINNSSGVYVPIGNNIFIDDVLQLENGIFDIGRNLLELDADAIIREANSFSESNMIQTNISFTDAGVKKHFPAIIPVDNYSFIYPMGSEGKYTPVEFAIDSVDAGGFIRVKAANEIHPTILNDTEPCNQIVDSLNVLKYHWLLEAGNITGFTGDASMKYYPEDYQIPEAPYDVSAYIAARLLLNSTQWNKYDQASFDETNELLLFSFANTDDDGISGDYTAGVEDPAGNCEGAIPDEVPAYITISNGDWTNAAIWESYPTPGEYPVPSGGPRGAIAIVKDTVTIPGNYILSYKTQINATGIIKVGTTFGHRLGIVEGTGTLQLERGNLPAGIYDDFFGRSGGTIEFAGNTDYDVLSEITNVRNLKFSGTGERRLPNLDFEVYGIFTIDGDDAFLEVINEHDQNMTLDSNVVFNQGQFDAGIGTSTVTFNGDFEQVISGTGSFTGTNAFRNVGINNSNGVTLSSPVEIKGTLALTSGVITTDATNILTINNTSETAVSRVPSTISNYVDGPMQKKINNGGDFVFPLGDAGRYGPVNIYNTTNGTPAYWEAQYFNSGHASSSVTGSLVDVSTDEYWFIDNPTPADAAEIELRWDSNSTITPLTTGDINEIVVAEYDGSDWVDKASDSPSGNNYDGTVKTSAAINVNPQYYTLGSRTTIVAQAYFTTLDDVCEGGTISVSFSGVDASNLDYSLTYEIDGTPTTEAIIGLPYSITASAAGNYVLTNFSYNNPPGHAGPPVVGGVNGSTVVVNAAPAQPTITPADGDASLTFCDGGSVILTSNAGTDYLWSTGATTQNINVTTSGNYTVQVSNAAGCYSIASAPKTVTVYPLPVFTPGAVPASICFGETSQLDANFNDGSTTFIWSPAGELDNSGIQNPVYTPTANPTTPVQVTTTFTVTVTDSNSCSDVETVDVELTRTPETGPQYHIENSWGN